MMFHYSELVSTFTSEPTCLAVSSDGQLMVAGTKQGMLHVINAHNRQVYTLLIQTFFLILSHFVPLHSHYSNWHPGILGFCFKHTTYCLTRTLHNNG